MIKRLIASDYDGTLRRNGEVSPEDVQAIRRWQAAGGLFGIVTGRGRTFPARIAPEGVACNIFICYNGALIMDKNSAPLREAKLSAETYKRLESAFRNRADARKFDVYDGEPAYFQYSALMPTCEAAEEFVSELNARFGGEANALANGLNINIVAKGEGKAEGVRRALALLSLAPDAAAVVGDDLNDLDMILELDGWAMESGREAVVKAAPHRAKSIEDLVWQLMGEGKDHAV